MTSEVETLETKKQVDEVLIDQEEVELKQEEYVKEAKDEEENGNEKAEDSSAKKGSSKKLKSDLSHVTPIERPSRERKTVERYTESMTRLFSPKPFSIEKGSGTQLNEIPNVVYKLSKRKPDDNLQSLHTVLFNKRGKVSTLKKNIGMFSGFVWTDDEQEDEVLIDQEEEELKQEEDVKEAKDEEENGNEKAEDSSAKKGSSKKLKSDSSHVTPIERPSRERKTVERYTESMTRLFSPKPFSIERGSGTQLNEIPNVVYKLTKRKPDDNLQSLHTVLFNKRGKVSTLKKNIGMFSGFVWTDDEEKQRTKVKEKLDKFTKEKLYDFCDLLNLQINKSLKKEEVSVKLVEFLESPHVTTEVLLAEKEQKSKKRKAKAKSSRTPSKKQKQSGEKRKRSSKAEEENNVDENEGSETDNDSQVEDDKNTPSKPETDEDEDKLEDVGDDEESKDEDYQQEKSSSKKSVAKDSGNKSKNKTKAVKKDDVKSPTKSNKKSSSKKLKEEKKSTNVKTKISAKESATDQGKGKTNKKVKAEPTNEEMHAFVVSILKEVDFDKATLSDIIKQLGTHFGQDLLHRKSEVKAIITDVINNMSGDEDEEDEEDEEKEADKEVKEVKEADTGSDDDNGNDNDDGDKNDS